MQIKTHRYKRSVIGRYLNDKEESVEELRDENLTNWEIVNRAQGALFTVTDLILKRWAFEREGGTPDLLMSALVNGYTVEQTPEEKVHEYYDSLNEQDGFESAEQDGILTTLDLLGIKIEGVNA